MKSPELSLSPTSLLQSQASPLTSSEVYTDLHGLQKIKNEENQEQALKKVAQQFESLFMSMMIKSMRSANEVFESGNIFNSNESKFYRDLLDQQMSLSLSHGKGLGIADALYRQLSKSYGDTDSRIGESDANNLLHNKRLEQPPYQSDADGGLHELEQTEKIDTKKNSSFNSPEEFIRGIYHYAKSAAQKLGVDTETLIAQSALETGWGQHIVSDSEGDISHNLFNIKTGSQWSGGSVGKTVLEFSGGTAVKEQAQFRKYENFQQSFDDYITFIRDNPRYQDALNAKDGDSYIQSLKDFGFATDPNYVEKVRNVRSKVIQVLSDFAREFFAQQVKGDL